MLLFKICKVGSSTTGIAKCWGVTFYSIQRWDFVPWLEQELSPFISLHATREMMVGECGGGCVHPTQHLLITFHRPSPYLSPPSLILSCKQKAGTSVSTPGTLGHSTLTLRFLLSFSGSDKWALGAERPERYCHHPSKKEPGLACLTSQQGSWKFSTHRVYLMNVAELRLGVF